jgi:mannose-1-phosphate guanylyltransferase/mannose-6-phosphate isomerase
MNDVAAITAPEPVADPMTRAGTIVPVIMSGGSGSRLWPVSRESFPKQFWPLVTARSMIAETAARALGPSFAPPIVVCNQEHRFLVAEQMRAAGVDGARIVLEPAGRNSAPALAAAALLAAQDDPAHVVWMMAADAAITELGELHRLLDVAVAAARDGHITTFGMRPTSPETGYGYVEVGEAIAGLPGAHRVLRFLEKPDAATARRLVADGRHLWNAGMFVATAETLLAEFERHEPALLAEVRAALRSARRDLDFIRLGDEFARAASISFDYAVAERTDRAAVVPASIGWSDIGSWGALWEISPKDDAGNVTVGDVLIESARDCYVRSDGILTAVVGLEGAVVVVMEDAVLAMPRDRSQEVKRIVDRLRAAKRHEAVAHNRTYRPWGFSELLIQGERFQVRRVVVEPGHQLSLQKHYNRAEHWIVVHGTAVVTRDGERVLARENESIYLPLGSLHRVENPGRIPLTLIEVQSGSYLGEDDVERVEGGR